jgi:hypothetical protein
MDLARECGRTQVHLGNPENAEGFRGCWSPLPAAADFIHGLLLLPPAVSAGELCQFGHAPFNGQIGHRGAVFNPGLVIPPGEHQLLLALEVVG